MMINRQLFPLGGILPCELNPQTGALAHLDDPFHSQAQVTVAVPVEFPGGEDERLTLRICHHRWRKHDARSPLLRGSSSGWMRWSCGCRRWCEGCGGRSCKLGRTFFRVCPAMRLYSTPQSAEAREVSVLAVVETLVAVSVSLWLVVKLDSWTHVAIGAALAPLVLLRTPESTELGLRWGRRPAGRIKRSAIELSSLGMGVVSVLGIVANHLNAAIMGFDLGTLASVLTISYGLICFAFFPAIRVAATFVSSLRSPAKAVSAIPGNWSRVYLCTDLAHPPEVMAGSELSDWPLRLSSTQELVGRAKETSDGCLARLGLYAIFIPAYLYRLSIKSTALVWAPLLWIIPKATSKLRLKTRLEYLHKSSMGRLVFYASIGTLGFFAFKIALYAGFAEVSTWWSSLSFSDDLKPLVEPELIPRWQLSSAINSVVALGLYFYADWALTRIRNDDLDEGGRKFAEALTRTGAVVRATLSLYSISSVLYIVSRVAWEADWLPRLGDRWFPWG